MDTTPCRQDKSTRGEVANPVSSASGANKGTQVAGGDGCLHVQLIGHTSTCAYRLSNPTPWHAFSVHWPSPHRPAKQLSNFSPQLAFEGHSDSGRIVAIAAGDVQMLGGLGANLSSLVCFVTRRYRAHGCSVRSVAAFTGKHSALAIAIVTTKLMQPSPASPPRCTLCTQRTVNYMFGASTRAANWA